MLIARASSLVTNSHSRDLLDLRNQNLEDPYLLTKRITADDVELAVRDAYYPGVRYDADLLTLELGSFENKGDVLQQKFFHGGLSARYEAMRRRALTAESDLLERATRHETGYKEVSQIENIVLGECDDAHLRASTTADTYGSAMLIDVQDRLKQIAEKEPGKVHDAPYEVLVGVAGLLTGDCKVWWSKTFNMEPEK